MYKRLLIVAAFMVAFTNVAGLTSVSANGNSGNNGNGNSNGNGNNGNNTPVVPIAPTPPIFNIPDVPPMIDEGETKKIAFCHATGSNTNPYVYVDTSVNAFFHAGHHTHQDNEDIVPAFTYIKHGQTISFGGLNWNSTSAAFIANECKTTVTPPVKVANLSAAVVCDIANSRAKITLTNTGTASGSATVNGKNITVAANDDKVTYVSTPSGKVQITIVIAGVTVYDEALDCRAGGQGGVKDPVITTPIITPATPVDQAGQGTVTGPSVASLPYTAGESTQPIALIISAIAAIVAIAGTLIKKAYLKQI